MMLKWFFLLVLLSCVSHLALPRYLKESSNETEFESRVYFLKKVGGPGCPYTASWLIHINLYRKVTWYLDITKMEAATFNM
jgi:hypothetical protein